MERYTKRLPNGVASWNYTANQRKSKNRSVFFLLLQWIHQKTEKKKPMREKECIVCGGKTEEPRESQIDAINQKAREAGMTYGQYQALRSGMIPTAETVIRSYRERAKWKRARLNSCGGLWRKRKHYKNN